MCTERMCVTCCEKKNCLNLRNTVKDMNFCYLFWDEGISVCRTYCLIVVSENSVIWKLNLVTFLNMPWIMIGYLTFHENFSWNETRSLTCWNVISSKSDSFSKFIWTDFDPFQTFPKKILPSSKKCFHRLLWILSKTFIWKPFEIHAILQ